jgi:hypothetical protein
MTGKFCNGRAALLLFGAAPAASIDPSEAAPVAIRFARMVASGAGGPHPDAFAARIDRVAAVGAVLRSADRATRRGEIDENRRIAVEGRAAVGA